MLIRRELLLLMTVMAVLTVALTLATAVVLSNPAPLLLAFLALVTACVARVAAARSALRG